MVKQRKKAFLLIFPIGAAVAGVAQLFWSLDYTELQRTENADGTYSAHLLGMDEVQHPKYGMAVAIGTRWIKPNAFTHDDRFVFRGYCVDGKIAWHGTRTLRMYCKHVEESAIKTGYSDMSFEVVDNSANPKD